MKKDLAENRAGRGDQEHEDDVMKPEIGKFYRFAVEGNQYRFFFNGQMEADGFLYLIATGRPIIAHVSRITEIRTSDLDRDLSSIPATQDVIAATQALWQSRATKVLTREDARQIIENVSGFFQILYEWAAQR
ncbi:MAG TPA: hypothetical protein VIW47_08625 [Nitrospiraceae bacterium]|jgi:hypothetical protein